MDWFSPPKMAAAILALVIATVVTWVFGGHRTLPLPQEPSPVVAAFAELDRAVPLVTPITVIPIKKGQASSVMPKTTSAPKGDKRLFDEELSGRSDSADADSGVTERHAARDVCARHGGHRVEFRRHHHEMWRCAYPHHRRD